MIIFTGDKSISYNVSLFSRRLLSYKMYSTITVLSHCVMVVDKSHFILCGDSGGKEVSGGIVVMRTALVLEKFFTSYLA